MYTDGWCSRVRLPALSLWTLASLQLNAEKEAKRRLEQELWVESRANAAYEAYRVNGRASDGKRVGAAPTPYTPPEVPQGKCT